MGGSILCGGRPTVGVARVHWTAGTAPTRKRHGFGGVGLRTGTGGSMSEQTRRAARLAAAGLVVVLTVPPAGAGGSTGELSFWCLVCGSWGTADLILNVLLFVPMGLVVARPEGGGRSVLVAIATGALLSGTVEAIQLFMPGRHPALADLLSNTAGAAVGGVLAVTADRWLRPGPGVSSWLGTAWGAGAAIVLMATAWLLTPVLSSDDHRVQWAPALEQYATFPGEVLEARLGRAPLRLGVPDDEGRQRARSHLRHGGELTMRVTFGAPPPSLAPVLRIVDGGGRDLLILGQDGSDLVYRVRRRADGVRLRRPELRARGILAEAGPGDTLVLAAGEAGRARAGDGICLRVGERLRCGLGFRSGRGWALLADFGLGTAANRGLDAAWIGLLFLPLGFWYRPRRTWAFGVLIAGAGLLAAPAFGPLLAAGWAEVIGVVAGLGAGVSGQRLVRAWLPSTVRGECVEPR